MDTKGLYLDEAVNIWNAVMLILENEPRSHDGLPPQTVEFLNAADSIYLYGVLQTRNGR